MRQVTDKIMSIKEMGDLVDPNLLNAVGVAFEEYTKANPITVSSGEMTLAAGLSVEIGHSCDTEEEVRINAEAYHQFILIYALRIFKSRMSTH